MSRQTINPVKTNPLTGEETKICTFCGREMPVEKFYKTTNGKGYRSICIECSHELDRERSRRRKERKEANKQVVEAFLAQGVKQDEAPKPEAKEERVEAAPSRSLVPVLEKYDTKTLLAELKKRKDFSLKDAFEPTEFISALYAKGYRGEISILVEHKVQLRNLG